MKKTQDKRLFLIDAYAMIFRGYYALIRSPRLTSKGMNTSAIFGFTNSLIELIKREDPTHLAVVFDVEGKTFRHDDFKEYKSNRSETPEAIKIAVPYIHQILEAMHIPILGMEGYEADDVIGTLSYKAEKQGYNVYMVTPDKDFAQLVTEKVKIYKPRIKGGDIEILGVEEVKEKYDIQNPKQIIDLLAMMGDNVDNIPGLEGVGEKTAKKFLQNYGSIENLLSNTAQLKGRLKEKIEASAQLGILSKKLATIDTNVPIEFHQEKYNVDIPDFDKVKKIFEELEFRRLYENMCRAFSSKIEISEFEETVKKKSLQAKDLNLFSRFYEPDIVTSSKEDIKSNNHLYQYINTSKALLVLVKNLLEKPVLAFDIETTSLNEVDEKLTGISFSYRKGLAYYIPISQDQRKSKLFLDIIRPVFEKKDQIKIAHNLKYDYKVLYQNGIKIKGKLFDTMIAHYLLSPDDNHSIEYLSEIYLNYHMLVSIETVIGKKEKKQRVLNDVTLEVKTEYAAEYVDITFQLYELFSILLKSEKLEKLFMDVEMPLVKVLAHMELIGVSLDKGWLLRESINLESDLRKLEQDIFNISGEEFNMNSPRQLGEILFEKIRIDPKAKKTKTGQYATSEDILQKLVSKHEIIKHILDYRQLQKLKSTYVDALSISIDPHDNRVHTYFSQTTVATGRLSSVNPNLQNIPIRTSRGRQIRRAFVAGEGKKLISADYSQIELRLIAEISGERNMIEDFSNGVDIHVSTAAKLFKVPIEEVSKMQRSQAKTVNFGIIYGQGVFSMAEQTGIMRSEAKEMIDAYYKTYPRLRDYMQGQVKKARDLGYVETILGRKRYLKDINSNNFLVRSHAERNAVNAPIQGSAADIIKLAMIRIDHQLKEKKFDTKMLLQVHDELIFESPEEEVEIVSNLIKSEMERVYPTKVPLEVEVGIGNNWLEAH